MIFSKPIEEIIETRKSVRSYNNITITKEQRTQINHFIETIESPFEGNVRFKLIDKEDSEGSYHKVGTYGIIHGAKHFICCAVKKQDREAVLSLGYKFEKIILFLTSLDLGTCWLGGTFNRDNFATLMALKKDEMIPIVSPVGTAAENKTLREKIMRKVAKGDSRKPFGSIFFENNFETPLAQKKALYYRAPLEMMRLAPSASNKQPWLVLKNKNNYHFYINHKDGYSVPLYDFSRNDLGIAMCHFELTAIENELKGKWVFKKELSTIEDENKEYIQTWVAE